MHKSAYHSGPVLSIRVVEHLRSQTESLEDAGSERIDEDVGLGDETLGDRKSGWVLGIERDGAFSFAEGVIERRRWSIDASN
jgi:hypothetical protein